MLIFLFTQKGGAASQPPLALVMAQEDFILQSPGIGHINYPEENADALSVKLIRAKLDEMAVAAP